MSLPILPIHQGRIWERLMQLAEIGRFGSTGVNRQALTDGDLAAKQWLVSWARTRNFAVSVDDIGNLFVRRPGSDPEAMPVAVGSHLDTEPTGGRFDGAYGVVAAMELLDALTEQAVVTRHPVDLVVWQNEEGSRFMPGCMGAKAHVDPRLLPAMLASSDANGTTVGQALRHHETALEGIARRTLGSPLAAFLEAHIEQGPVLEGCNEAVAAVRGIQGRRIFEMIVPGKTGHAGTVPQSLRQDALQRALPILQALYARAAQDEDIRITPGRLVLEPNSPSVIPGSVKLAIDIRHPDLAILADVSAWLSTLALDGISGPPIAVREVDRTDPATFDVGLTELVRAACWEVAGSDRSMISGASHDAHALATFCPTTMVFVRCHQGTSHHEDEFASPEDLAAGAKVLGACLLHASGAVLPGGGTSAQRRA